MALTQAFVNSRRCGKFFDRTPLFSWQGAQLMPRKVGTLLLSSFILLVLSVQTVAQERTILAVMEMEDRSGLRSADLGGATNYLRGLLAKSAKFEIVDKGRQEAKRKRVISDLQLESGDPCYGDKCRVRLA